MKITNKSGFSLVELLVVITILAIISVVAYQNFGGATDKAISGRKINDIGTIETALQQFKAEKNYYPMPMAQSETNLWGYNTGTIAQPSNSIRVNYDGQEIRDIETADTHGGGRVHGTGSSLGAMQIGAKGVIGYTNDFGKKYLSKELYDPEIGDIKLTGSGNKMIDLGIGRYVYGIYAQPKTAGNWNAQGISGIYYNIATTIKKKDSESYETYLVGDYDQNSCETPSGCPESLIGTASGLTISTSLVNKTEQNINISSTGVNQGVPYTIRDFSD